MTVKQLHEITNPNTIIEIAYNGNSYKLSRDMKDPLFLSACNFVVEEITAWKENAIEALIKTIPAKE